MIEILDRTNYLSILSIIFKRNMMTFEKNNFNGKKGVKRKTLIIIVLK